MLQVENRPRSPTRSEGIAQRLKPGPKYSPGVLIGNWVEDSTECVNQGAYFVQPDETEVDRDKMKPESRQHDFRQNKLNGTQGIGVYKVIHHDSHLRCGNYTTTNDLVYNHLPKPLCGPEMRYYKKSEHQWYPQPDLMKCYGDNLTKWGLRAHKQFEWACTDVSDYSSSLYEDTFVAPMKNQYIKANERKARNAAFTSTFRYLMTKPITKPTKRK